MVRSEDSVIDTILSSGWGDPNPPIQVIEHDGFFIVRDDLLGYGSKARFVDYFVRNLDEREIVFGGCPATGYAQISLPVVAKRYGKSVHLFMAHRDPKKYTDFQKYGMEMGANYHWVQNGMLSVTKARAREYQQQDPTNRILLPLGLEHPTVLASIVIVAQSQIPFIPDHIWSVGSSGTLSRGLQLAFPTAEVHCVSVGHTMNEREIGRAIVHHTQYPFDKPVKKEELPPFNSARTYDAKGWFPMVKWYRTHAKPNKVLFWNVA